MNARALPGVGEHRYYVAAAIGVIVAVLAGFSVDVPLLSHLGSLSVLVGAHGLIMLSWIALFFVQALLVARHRVYLHMRLGIFGAALAIAVVVADTATVIIASRLGGNHMPTPTRWTTSPRIVVKRSRKNSARCAKAFCFALRSITHA